jgi:hypothetical protein
MARSMSWAARSITASHNFASGRSMSVALRERTRVAWEAVMRGAFMLNPSSQTC